LSFALKVAVSVFDSCVAGEFAVPVLQLSAVKTLSKVFIAQVNVQPTVGLVIFMNVDVTVTVLGHPVEPGRPPMLGALNTHCAGGGPPQLCALTMSGKKSRNPTVTIHKLKTTVLFSFTMIASNRNSHGFAKLRHRSISIHRLSLRDLLPCQIRDHPYQQTPRQKPYCVSRYAHV
jgi:hypothetical protein